MGGGGVLKYANFWWVGLIMMHDIVLLEWYLGLTTCAYGNLTGSIVGGSLLFHAAIFILHVSLACFKYSCFFCLWVTMPSTILCGIIGGGIKNKH